MMKASIKPRRHGARVIARKICNNCEYDTLTVIQQYSAPSRPSPFGLMLSSWNRFHMHSGPRFNIKMSSYQYRKSHCGDKTVVRSSYLYNGISYTGKTSLYWIRALLSGIICYEIKAMYCFVGNHASSSEFIVYTGRGGIQSDGTSKFTTPSFLVGRVCLS